MNESFETGESEKDIWLYIHCTIELDSGGYTLQETHRLNCKAHLYQK